MAFTLQSAVFENQQPIPMRYSKEAENISPFLEWSGEPIETKEFALLMEDPDAPEPMPFVHWLFYGIQPHVHSLQEGFLNKNPTLESSKSSLQGKNSFGEYGYGGPLPPVGDRVHHYIFRLFALDRKLGLPAGINKEELMKSMKGHILAETELVGTYQRITEQKQSAYR